MKVGRTIRVRTPNTENKGQRRTNREASRTVVVTYKNPLHPTEKADPAEEKADPPQGPDATHPDALDEV